MPGGAFFWGGELLIFGSVGEVVGGGQVGICGRDDCRLHATEIRQRQGVIFKVSIGCVLAQMKVFSARSAYKASIYRYYLRVVWIRITVFIALARYWCSQKVCPS